MDKVYSHNIYLPAYLKVMNVDTAIRPPVHDNNLIDHYAFHLRLVLDSKVSLAYEVEVDKLFQISMKVLQFESQVSIKLFNVILRST